MHKQIHRLSVVLEFHRGVKISYRAIMGEGGMIEKHWLKLPFPDLTGRKDLTMAFAV